MVLTSSGKSRRHARFFFGPTLVITTVFRVATVVRTKTKTCNHHPTYAQHTSQHSSWARDAICTWNTLCPPQTVASASFTNVLERCSHGGNRGNSRTRTLAEFDLRLKQICQIWRRAVSTCKNFGWNHQRTRE